MAKKRHKKAPISVGRIALACAALVLAIIVGISIGVYTDPLPPQTCADRLVRLGAPLPVVGYVCYGQRVTSGGSSAL